MSNLLGIGASGVRAYQSALSVVGENIANAGTAGYVRRDVRLTENAAVSATGVVQLSRNAASGVDATGVIRSWDSFKATAVRTASSDLSSTQAGINYLDQIETTLSTNGISGRLGDFFNAVTALAADPTGQASRANLLTQADATATAFRGTAAALDTMSADVVTDARTTVDTLNGLADSLAQVNAALPRTKADSAAAAALMDQRDAILDKMSSVAGISVSLAGNGVATVRIGGPTGPALVDNLAVNRLAMSASASGVVGFSISPGGGERQAVQVSGGALAGLADASTRIANVRAGLDDVANGFAAAMNAAQAGGVDSDGHAGKAMFTAAYATATPQPQTSGGASVDVSLAAGASLSADGYVASWSQASGQWTVSRMDGTGSPVSGTGALAIDGMTLTFGGTPRDGDSYAVASGSGARGLTAAALSTSEIAAASAWTADAPITNGGSGTIAVASQPGASGLPGLSRYKVTYTGGNLVVTDPASGDTLLTTAYVAGQAIEGAGFSLSMTGTPVEGDSFTLTPTGAGSSGNGNLAAFARARQSGAFENRVDGLAASNAATLAQRKTLAEAQDAIRDNAISSRDAVSGVNLDNEAVELLRFQQAYQASSRVISVARDIFQNILDVAR